MDETAMAEGGACPKCGSRPAAFVAEGDCTCHINPPCEAHMNAILTCLACGYEAD